MSNDEIKKALQCPDVEDFFTLAVPLADRLATRALVPRVDALEKENEHLKSINKPYRVDDTDIPGDRRLYATMFLGNLFRTWLDQPKRRWEAA